MYTKLNNIVQYVASVTALLEEYDESLYYLHQSKLKIKLLEMFHDSYDEETKQKIIKERETAKKFLQETINKIQSLTGMDNPEEARIFASNVRTYMREIMTKFGEEFVSQFESELLPEQMIDALLDHIPHITVGEDK